jgi:hypothetical protein
VLKLLTAGGSLVLQIVLTSVAAAPPILPELLRSVGALPAHIAGRFDDITICRQTASGTFYVFDRRAQGVFSVAPNADAPVQLVHIGAEPGRILQPYAFDLGADETFVVADAPKNRSRVQAFVSTGGRFAGFYLQTGGLPVMMEGITLSGFSSIAYSGRSIYVSQPSTGSLITERGLDGVSARSFGELRGTGHENDRDVHLGLNSGLVVINPEGGFYFVFVAGVPMFRKYDYFGALLFERHIEGVELDDYMKSRPTAWPRRKTSAGEVPAIRPAIRAAAVDTTGNLWVSLDSPYTYVYDPRGDKQRVVQLRGAGLIAPTSLSFTKSGRLLVTPGCYMFDTRLTPAPTPKLDARR